MWYLYVNGSWIPTPAPTRGELFGDGLFETIRFWRGQPLFLSDHLHRLIEGARILSLQLPLPPQFLIGEIHRLAQAYPEARLKLLLYRIGEGAYTPSTSHSHLRLCITPLSETPFPLGPPQLAVRFPVNFIVPTPWSPYKTLSALGYVQAASYAQARGCHEAILVSAGGLLSETSRANLFFWDGKVLRTPALGTGCIAGICRLQVIRTAHRLGIPVEEGFYPPDALLSAVESFTTNVVQGIVPLLELRDVRRTFHVGERSIAAHIAKHLHLS
ncbi:MAG: aminotransferase class IV [Bacteroidia bacterium]|nr:aminotransferase class IV [Bacteroidia bacterium]MDW8015816.1 aminotransferase class IV [Bacteroidia bacterium]